MKPFSFLLAGSLLTNVGIIIFLIWATGLRPPAAEMSADASRADTALFANAPEAVVQSELWAELAPDDLATLVDRLRASGFPDQVIRAILSAQLEVEYAPRRKAIEAEALDRPYWEQAVADPKTQLERRALAREQAQRIAELMGNDDLDQGTLAAMRRRFGDLSDDQLKRIYQIEDDHNMRRVELQGARASSGLTPMSAADREAITALDKGMQADIATVMSAQEMESYQLRGGRTAQSVRSTLAAFEPSESEFRTVVALQEAFNERHGQILSAPSQDELRARSEAQRQLTETIKSALGPERGADYERALNIDYRRTKTLVERLQLPPDTAQHVYSIQEDILQRSRTPPTGGLEQRNQMVAQLNEEAATRLTAILGPRGFDAYKQNVTWLQNLQPIVVRPPVPPSGR